MEQGWPWAGCAVGTELGSLQAGDAPPENRVCCGSAVDSQSINKQWSSLLIPGVLGLVASMPPGPKSAVPEQLSCYGSTGPLCLISRHRAWG